MNSFTVANLKPDTYFSSEVRLDESFILLHPLTPVTNELIKALMEWNFKEVFSNGTSSTDAVSQVEPEEHEPPVVTEKVMSKSPFNVKLLQNIEKITATIDDNTDKLSTVKAIYAEYLDYINSVYTRFATHKELQYKPLYEAVKELCIFINQNRRHILRINPEVESENKDFLIYHSMKSTVIAIVIGIQLKIPLSKLTEIGVACILHEIGMVKLPPQYYMTNRILTPLEKKTIFTHPVLSYDIIKGYDFPLSISLAALEHHEKEDGSGYPRKLAGINISLYAKIISVACSFEAITAPRQHRSAQSSHEAMVELLKNTGKQYDETVIKALLYSMSLYPVGSYVYLSDGKIGLVADTNPEDPKNPIVQLLNEKTENGADKFVKSGKDQYQITRVLTTEETKNLLNTIAPKEDETTNKEDLEELEEI